MAQSCFFAVSLIVWGVIGHIDARQGHWHTCMPCLTPTPKSRLAWASSWPLRSARACARRYRHRKQCTRPSFSKTPSHLDASPCHVCLHLILQHICEACQTSDSQPGSSTWACGRCGCSSPSLPQSSARRSARRNPPAPPPRLWIY